MYQALSGQVNKKYGKELEFVHSPEVLDEQSSGAAGINIQYFHDL